MHKSPGHTNQQTYYIYSEKIKYRKEILEEFFNIILADR